MRSWCRLIVFFRLLCCAVPAVLAGYASAQDFPSKPVRFIVPFPPGGQVDILTRIVVGPLPASLGQPVLVEPKPGASGLIGASAVAMAPADGHVVLSGAFALGAAHMFNKEFRYDMRREFIPVAMHSTSPSMFVVPKALAINDLKEFIQYVRKNPGKLNYGHVGLGSTTHLPIETLRQAHQLDIVAVPYKGQAEMISDLISGRIQLLVGGPAVLAPHIQSGALKAIAVTGDRRLDLFPDLATNSEQGFPDLIGEVAWYGLFVPAGTPKGVVDRINAEVNKSLSSPEVNAQLKKAFAQPQIGTPEDFRRYLDRELGRIDKLARDLGIRVQ